METHALVWGPADHIDRDIEELLIGYRVSGDLFEGLTRNPARIGELFGGSAVVEPAGLDDIMLYTVKGKNYDTARV